MLIEKKVDVPAHTRIETDYVECELCKSRTSDESNWGGEAYRVNEVRVRLRGGTSFPEGGTITETIVDLCPECFETKLLPWIRSHGGTERQREIDF